MSVTVRVGNGRAVHLASGEGQLSTFCGAEGGRGKTMGTWVNAVDAPVTCRRCSPGASAAPASAAPVPTPAPAVRYDRRAFLSEAAERLERQGDHDRAAWARAELAAL